MKFLLFSDFHHYPGVFKGGTFEHLALFQRRAEEENCDFIIHGGDFCHGPSLVPDMVKAYNDFHIPSYHVLGNHDADKTPFEDTVKAYNMPGDYYFFDVKGYRMVVCNPNFLKMDGEYLHYSMGNYYGHAEKRDHMPPEQLAWLEKTIDSSPYPCILISHESFEREADGVQNYTRVRAIIDAANRKKPHSVLMCINGHHHRDNLRILENVCYFEINSVVYDWVDKKHDLFPAEYNEAYSLMGNTVCYNDPLYAIVTLEGTNIKIQGTESSMFMGITREMTGNPPFDRMGRPVVPKVQSVNITL